MFGGRAGQALKQRRIQLPTTLNMLPLNLDRPGMAGAAANVERQRLLKTITNQAVNPGLDIRQSPGTAVVAMPQGVPVYGKVQAAPAPSGGGGGGGGGCGGGGHLHRLVLQHREALRLPKKLKSYRNSS
jgi:hypothetical protein